MSRTMRASRRRRGPALRKRYGRAGHPLLPRLVMYLEKHFTPASETPTFIIEGKLQRGYGGPWKVVHYQELANVKAARAALRSSGELVAVKLGVPSSHVEYVT
jgi:hypothetical protein